MAVGAGIERLASNEVEKEQARPRLAAFVAERLNRRILLDRKPDAAPFVLARRRGPAGKEFGAFELGAPDAAHPPRRAEAIAAGRSDEHADVTLAAVAGVAEYPVEAEGDSKAVEGIAVGARGSLVPARAAGEEEKEEQAKPPHEASLASSPASASAVIFVMGPRGFCAFDSGAAGARTGPCR